MLSIVSYDASDTDGEEEFEEEKRDASKKNPVDISGDTNHSRAIVHIHNPPNREDETESETETSIFDSLNFSASISDMLSGLPPPKRKKMKVSESLFTDLSPFPKKLTTLMGKNSVVKKDVVTKNGKVVPPSNSDSDDSDTDTPNNTAVQNSKVGTVPNTEQAEIKQSANPLLNKLPKARTSFDLKKTQMLIPDSVKNKQKLALSSGKPVGSSQKNSVNKQPISVGEDEADESADNSMSYFNLDQVTAASTSNQYFDNLDNFEENSPEVDDQEITVDASSCQFNDNSVSSNSAISNFASYQESESFVTAATTSNALDPQILQRLQGRKKNAGNIAIKDVNAQDQLEDVSIQVTKGISEEQEDVLDPIGSSRQDKSDPNQRRAKSKHQLNWLVSQAKVREVALKNQWADNRMNKRATQMKYGF